MADHVEVKVGCLPGKMHLVGLPMGERTVAHALKGAELAKPGKDQQIRVNGAVADLNTELDEGAIVLLVRNVRGN